MTIIAMTNTGAKLIGADGMAVSIVYDLLSYDDETPNRRAGIGMGSWNSKKSFLRLEDHIFEAGFVPMVKAALHEHGYPVTIRDMRTPIEPRQIQVDLNGITLRDYQLEGIDALIQAKRGVLQCATGSGKCLGVDTPVLMYDGTIKKVQDVQVGDQLMGPGSLPRNVLSTTSGQSKLYRVVPTRGDPYIVNDAHILSLKTTAIHSREKGLVVNVPVEEYIAAGSDFRHTHKGWRAPADFKPGAALKIDPYFLGLWLGDGRGSSRWAVAEITTGDKEIEDYIYGIAWRNDLDVRDEPNSDNSRVLRIVGPHGGNARTRPLSESNPIAAALRDYNLFNNKHIPLDYKRASREDRLQLLGGILDTDGDFAGGMYYITLKSERLIDDIAFLSRSLGFASYKKVRQKTCTNNGKIGTYFSIGISGEGIENVPCRLARRKAEPRRQKKDVLVTGLKIEDAGYGDYYGFELDGDKLFMLGDFTVTHNTEMGIGITQRLGLRTLWLTHKLDLVGQTRKRYQARLGRTVGMISEGEWLPSDITVATVQTLMAWLKREPEKVETFLHGIEFLCVDEAHRSSGNSFFTIISRCTNAYFRASLTATPLMKGKREDDLKLIATSGPIVYKITNNDLIELGILARPHFKFVEVPGFGWSESRERRRLKDNGTTKTAMSSALYQSAYTQGIVNNALRNRMIVEDVQELVAEGRPTVVLVSREKHGYILQEKLTEAGLRATWVFGKDDAKTRSQALQELASGKIEVIVASTILDEGLDEAAIAGIVLAGGGKSQISLFQRVGRAVRAKTGAAFDRFGNTAKIVAYVDTGNKTLMKHSALNYKAVKEEDGWVIDEIQSWDVRKQRYTGVGEQQALAV